MNKEDRKDLVERLRGIYRIPITDGLGPAGGEEPDNPNEFVRTFPSPPIQIEAADELDRLRRELEEARRALIDTRALVGEAAMTGFNCHEGDWAERLYANNGNITAVLRAGGEGL